MTASVPFDVTTRPIRLWFFLLAIVAIGPVAVYANNGTVPLLAVACLGLPNPRQAWRHFRRLLVSPCGLALIALVAWSLVSTAWAPGGFDALMRIVKVAAIMAAGVLFIVGLGQLNAGERRNAGRAIVITVAMIIILIVVEFGLGGSPLADIKAAQSSRFVFLPDLLGTAAPVIAVMIWPAIALLWAPAKRWLGLSLVIVGGIVVVALLPLASSVLALALGALAFGFALSRRHTITAIGIVVAGYVLAGPFLSTHAINLTTIIAISTSTCRVSRFTW